MAIWTETVEPEAHNTLSSVSFRDETVIGSSSQAFTSSTRFSTSPASDLRSSGSGSYQSEFKTSVISYYDESLTYFSSMISIVVASQAGRGTTLGTANSSAGTSLNETYFSYTYSERVSNQESNYSSYKTGTFLTVNRSTASNSNSSTTNSIEGTENVSSNTQVSTSYSVNVQTSTTESYTKEIYLLSSTTRTGTITTTSSSFVDGIITYVTKTSTSESMWFSGESQTSDFTRETFTEFTTTLDYWKKGTNIILSTLGCEALVTVLVCNPDFSTYTTTITETSTGATTESLWSTRSTSSGSPGNTYSTSTLTFTNRVINTAESYTVSTTYGYFGALCSEYDLHSEGGITLTSSTTVDVIESTLELTETQTTTPFTGTCFPFFTATNNRTTSTNLCNSSGSSYYISAGGEFTSQSTTTVTEECITFYDFFPCFLNQFKNFYNLISS